MSDNDDVIDYSPLYAKFEKNKFVNKNPLAFQHPCTALICAGTGMGKTNTLLNILSHPTLQMTYDQVYLCCPSLDEPAYQFLEQYYEKKRQSVFKELKRIDKTKTIDDVPQIFFHISNPKDIPQSETQPSDSPKLKRKTPGTQPPALVAAPKYVLKNDSNQKIVICDDFTNVKIANELITNLCQRNRKVNTSLIILNHNIYTLPPTLKRNLSNGYICLFAASSKRMVASLAQDFALNISKDDFYKIFHHATKLPYSFLLIDLKDKDPSGKLKFRKKFTGTNLIAMVSELTPTPDNSNSDLLKYLTGILEEST